MIAELRREYSGAALKESDVEANPIRQFERWFAEAVAAEVRDPNAMVVATADSAGRPSARVVLLKAVDDRGFAFYTDCSSRKGSELAQNPQAALVFFWSELSRQVRAVGAVRRMGVDESEAYFRTRPRGSRLAALASHQSSVLEDREQLRRAFETLAELHPDSEIPMPARWCGLRIFPAEIEFWQGRPNRLHDRIHYLRSGDDWTIRRLSP